MQRKTAALCLGLLFTIALGGCEKPGPAAEKPLPQAVLIRVASPQGRAMQAMKSQGVLAGKRLNLTVEVTSRAEGSFPEANENATDIWIIRPDELGEFAHRNLLTPAPDELKEPGNPISWEDFFPLYREKTLIWNRRLHALPLLGESQVCFFREDLFSNPTRQAEFKKQFNEELKPPQSWSDFLKIARFFSMSEIDGGKTLPPLTESNQDLVREFLTLSAGFCRRPVAPDEPVTAGVEESIFSFLYDANTAQPVIDGPGFVKGLNLLREMQGLRKTAPVGKGQNDSHELSSLPVLALGDSSLAGLAQQTPALRDKYNFCPVPGAQEIPTGKKNEFRRVSGGNRIPYLGQNGYLGCVSSKSKNRALAFHLLAELASPKISERLAMEPGSGGFLRFTQLSRMRLDSFELDAGKTETLRNALRQDLIHPEIKNPAMASRLPGNAKRREALAVEIRDFLTGKTGVAQKALSQAAARWREIDRAWPEKEFKALVKISAGLIPD
ncbi:MAG: extracellular solute-binding protein [Gemmataceae bacterium]|nr:extracellular solute-binding protein [Gemmataceae bacterium]